MAGLFGGSQPKVEPPSRMPDPQDPRILEARRRRMSSMLDRTGRDSTILSRELAATAGNIMGTRGRLGA